MADKILEINKPLDSTWQTLIDIQKVLQNYPLDNIITDIKEIVQLLQKGFGILDSKSLNTLFEDIQTKAINIGDLRTNESKKNLSELLALYKQYLNVGGSASIKDIGGKKGVQDYLKANINKTDTTISSKKTGNDFAEEYENGIREKIPSIENTTKELIESVNAVLSNAQNDAYELGRGYAEKYEEGINELTNKKFDKLENGFQIIKAKISEFGNFNLSKNTDKEGLTKWVDQYIKYQEAGGQRPISDLTDNQKALSKITSEYEKQNKVRQQTIQLSKQEKQINTEKESEQIQQESKELEELPKSAKEATTAKENFTDANKDLLQSIIDSLKGIDNEGKSFENLNKLINNISSNKGEEKIEKLKAAIQSIFDLLNQNVDDNSLIKTLENLANQGTSLENLATVLKASKKKIQDAQNIIDNNNKDTSIIDWIDDLEKAEIQSEETKKSIQNALNISQEANSAGSALEILDNEINNIGDNADKAKEHFKEFFGWIRNQSGEITSGNYRYTQALSGVEDSKVTVKNGQSSEEYYINYDKLSKKIINADTEILKLQYQINNAQSDTKGLEETKSIIEQERDIYEQILDYAINSPDNKINESQRTILTSERAINEEKIRNSQYTKDAAKAEKDRVKTVAEYEKIMKAMQREIDKNNLSWSSFTEKIGDIDSSRFISSLTKEINTFKSEVANYTFDPLSEDSLDKLKRYQKEAKELFKQLTDPSKILADETAITNLYSKMARFLNDNSAMAANYKAELKSLIEIVKNGGEISKKELKGIASQFNQLEAKELGQTGNSFFTLLNKTLTSKNAQFFATYFSFQDIIRYTREVAQNVINIDSALTELRKVSDASTARLNQSFKKSAETAQELGQTIQHVINVTADWSRLGYSVDDAEELARVTALFTTVGDNMTADDASSYLISTLQGFHIAADDAEAVIDKYNEVKCCLRIQ